MVITSLLLSSLRLIEAVSPVPVSGDEMEREPTSG